MGTECLCKTKDSEESGGEDGKVDMEEPSWQRETEAEMSRSPLISQRFTDMEMKTRVRVSERGQGATWMYWSDVMELKLINGCSGLGGIQKSREGQMERAWWM